MKTNFNFKDAKVGDKVYHVNKEWLPIKSTYEDCFIVDDYEYYFSGIMVNSDHLLPTIYPYNPFEQNQERVVEVSINSELWTKRVLIAVKSGVAVCWNNAETLEEAKDEIYTCDWKIWREIQPPNQLTQEEKINILWERFGEFGNDIC